MRRGSAVCLALGVLWFRVSPARIEAWWLRRQMGRAGYAMDLAAFDSHVSRETQARAVVISNAVEAFSQAQSDAYRRSDTIHTGNLRRIQYVGFAARPMSTNSAWPASMFSWLLGERDSDLWELLRAQLDSAREPLDAACQALLERTDYLEPWWPSEHRYSGGQEEVVKLLSAKTYVDLHYHDDAAAWTSVLALTRLALAWSPQPFGVGGRFRLTCISHARDATWSGIQARTWTEDQLARLQREWEEGSRLADVPQVVAVTRLKMLESCRLHRASTNLIDRVIPLDYRLSEPGVAWDWFKTCLFYNPADFLHDGPALVTWHVLGALYPWHGSYRDEVAILRYFRDQEREMKEALALPSWAQMRGTPAITRQSGRLRGARRSVLLATFNEIRGYTTEELMKEAATAEAIRRVIVGALAIERHRLRHGVYPASIHEVTPLAAMPLVDFMDGKPLRYRRLPDDRFLLYSVGLDGEDNGGTFLPHGTASGDWPAPGSDILWPMPATKTEMEAAVRRDPDLLSAHTIGSADPPDVFPQAPP